ncbi:MAG TPA: sigma-70 family RNA polymerase sigma factor [Ktedonobacterales bacterium]|nr:sigma-70 family RNA polymerase sigma factor [Ktedonobacterales bacterium]
MESVRVAIRGWPAPGGARWAISAIVGARWNQRASLTEAPNTRSRAEGSAAPAKPAKPTQSGANSDPFEAFVMAHEGALFAYLWRMTGDESAAYDLRQETFIRAWRNFARVRAYERPLAWLYRVATNLALNYRRDQRGSASLAGMEDEPSDSDHAWRLAERDQVRATLLGLPPRERAALALREGQGLSCDEVAQALSVSPAAARTILWRARERFRDLYQRADTESTGGASQQGDVK